VITAAGVSVPGYSARTIATRASANVFLASAILLENCARRGMRFGCARKNAANFGRSVLCLAMSNRTCPGLGNGSRGVSVMTRNESSGIPCVAHARAMNSVSMSTAAAPDVRAISIRSSLESINDGAFRSAQSSKNFSPAKDRRPAFHH